MIRVVRTDKAASVVGWRVGRDHISQGLIGEGFGREGGRKGREVSSRPWATVGAHHTLAPSRVGLPPNTQPPPQMNPVGLALTVASSRG